MTLKLWNKIYYEIIKTKIMIKFKIKFKFEIDFLIVFKKILFWKFFLT